MNCLVRFLWDPEAEVWVATSKDVPGLVLESGPFDALVERVRFAIPELLELGSTCQSECSLVFETERTDRIQMYG